MSGPNDSEGKDGVQPLSSDQLLAADEPTAMWDEASLREAGFGQVAAAPEPTETSANPEAAGGSPAGPSIVIENMPGAEAAIRPVGTPVRVSPVAVVPRPKQPKGLSWPLTIGLAFALGLLVYLVVRFLR